MDIEFTKTIIELISSIFILIAAIIGKIAFKYKYDANVRDLYIENCKKIKEVLLFASSGNITAEIITQIREVKNDAEIYLHKDIIDFVNQVFDSICNKKCYEDKLTGILDEEKRVKIIELSSQESLQISNLLRKTAEVYRKHIVQSPIEKLKIWWLEEINSSFILSLFRKNKKTDLSS